MTKSEIDSYKSYDLITFHKDVSIPNEYYKEYKDQIDEMNIKELAVEAITSDVNRFVSIEQLSDDYVGVYKRYTLTLLDRTPNKESITLPINGWYLTKYVEPPLCERLLLCVRDCDNNEVISTGEIQPRHSNKVVFLDNLDIGIIGYSQIIAWMFLPKLPSASNSYCLK